MIPLALIGCAILLETLGQTSLAEAQKAGIRFEITTVTFLSESLKFLIALGLYVLVAPASPKANQFSWKRFFQFALPGVIYCFVNNIHIVLLHFLVPAELFMIWNFKILATAGWLRWLMGRHISRRQCVALSFLAVGCLCLVGYETDGKESKVVYTGRMAHLSGSVAALMACSLAALSNVIDELLMKQKPEDSLFFQNLHVYFWGILANCLCLLVKSHDRTSAMNGPGGFFSGYSEWVYAIVILNACSGLFISAIMRFIDNLALVHAHAASMIAVLAIAVLRFDFRGNAFTWLGSSLIAVATVWYTREGLSEASGASQKTDSHFSNGSLPVCHSEAGAYGSLANKTTTQTSDQPRII